MVNAFLDFMVTWEIPFVPDSEFSTRALNPKVHQFRLEFRWDHIGRYGLRSSLELIGKCSRKLEVAREIRFYVFISS